MPNFTSKEELHWTRPPNKTSEFLSPPGTLHGELGSLRIKLQLLVLNPTQMMIMGCHLAIMPICFFQRSGSPRFRISSNNGIKGSKSS